MEPYELSGTGELIVDFQLTVARYGTGLFTHTGGVNRVLGELGELYVGWFGG